MKGYYLHQISYYGPEFPSSLSRKQCPPYFYLQSRFSDLHTPFRKVRAHLTDPVFLVFVSPFLFNTHQFLPLKKFRHTFLLFLTYSFIHTITNLFSVKSKKIKIKIKLALNINIHMTNSLL